MELLDVNVDNFRVGVTTAVMLVPAKPVAALGFYSRILKSISLFPAFYWGSGGGEGANEFLFRKRAAD